MSDLMMFLSWLSFRKWNSDLVKVEDFTKLYRHLNFC